MLFENAALSKFNKSNEIKLKENENESIINNISHHQETSSHTIKFVENCQNEA